MSKERDTATPLPPTEHVYPFPLGKQPWAKLSVFSNAPTAHSLPVFQKEDTIRGKVDLELEKGDHIQGIIITVWGRVTPADESHRFFWKVTETLWEVSMGDPRKPSSTYQGKAWSSKLLGSYTWNFAVKLPSEASIQLKDGISANYPLPQSLTEKNQIIYHLEVKIARGILRPDSKIETNFIYLPRRRADQPSYMRQVSYSERSPLLGPDIDPDGWLRTKKMALRVVSEQERRASLELAIALPLQYGRGTTLPLWLRIESNDREILEALAKPSVPVVGLVGFERWDCTSEPTTSGRPSSPGTKPRDSHRALTCVAGATWWQNDIQSATSRQIEGEISLPKNMIPSFQFWKVGMEYQLHMLTPALEAFAFEADELDNTLASKVEVVTDQALGSTPISYVRNNKEVTLKEKVEKQVREFFVPPPPLVKGASNGGTGARDDILRGIMPLGE